MNAFHHTTVLLHETVDGLCPRGGGVYMDGTLGGGGHSAELLRRSGPDGCVYGIDQDQEALEAAGSRLAGFGERLIRIHGNFHDAKRLLAENGAGQLDGIVLDLGVSSWQFDQAERGFSYQADAKLDMRMDRTSPVTAATILAEKSEQELFSIIRDYGEEKWASRIAQFIVRERKQHPIETTGQLTEIIKAAIPAAARRDGPHPARRTFQALRIAVNDELDPLGRALEDLVDLLRPGGRIAVITFHSLEDRIVKQAFVKMENPCTCPPKAPICTCGKVRKAVRITRKPIVPTDEEIGENPRSRSAKLRIAEKCLPDGTRFEE